MLTFEDTYDAREVPLPGHSSDIANAAMAYHLCGWRVMPVRQNAGGITSNVGKRISKTPGYLSDYVWPSRYNVNGRRLVAHMNNRAPCNLAVLTGRQSGLVIFDIDEPSGGGASLQRLDIPKTLTVVTPGGRHLYFQYPSFSVSSWIGLFGRGIDVIADHGFALLPPSSSLDGVKYRWKDEQQDIAPLPDHIASILSALPRRSNVPNCLSLLRLNVDIALKHRRYQRLIDRVNVQLSEHWRRAL